MFVVSICQVPCLSTFHKVSLKLFSISCAQVGTICSSKTKGIAKWLENKQSTVGIHSLSWYVDQGNFGTASHWGNSVPPACLLKLLTEVREGLINYNRLRNALTGCLVTCAVVLHLRSVKEKDEPVPRQWYKRSMDGVILV